MKTRLCRLLAALISISSCLVACGDGDGGGGLSQAQLHGVGASCAGDADCYVDDDALACLPFKGGYCGLEGCSRNADCPPGSACVAHGDGKNYCFLVCADKVDCNATRSPAEESNCSSNVTFVDGKKGSKACVPPS